LLRLSAWSVSVCELDQISATYLSKAVEILVKSKYAAVTLDQSPVAALADASEITALPRDNLEVHEISKEEFERLRA
jgi:hypothetical protein